MKLQKPSSQNIEQEGYYKVSAKSASTLKTWLVAYGVGGPALFITHQDILDKLIEKGNAESVGLLFLAGVTLQVILSFTTKISMWCLYFGELHTHFKSDVRYKVCDWYSEQFWIDVAIDLGTILCFAAATVKVYWAFINH